jgi:hypothetical protein
MMKTIFDRITRDGLIDRIANLSENSIAEWGKMNAYQMVRHCALYEEMMLGKKQFKRVFLGYLFGKLALRSLIKDDAPLSKNTPTVPSLLEASNTGDFAAEKKKWIALIAEYGSSANTDIMHPFFGNITQEQIGCLVYKHSDHHLRQFNC